MIINNLTCFLDFVCLYLGLEIEIRSSQVRLLHFKEERNPKNEKEEQVKIEEVDSQRLRKKGNLVLLCQPA